MLPSQSGAGDQSSAAAPEQPTSGHKSHPPNQQVGGEQQSSAPGQPGKAASGTANGDEPLSEQSQATTVIQQQQQQQSAQAGQLYCGPQTSSRNTYWNFTRVGQLARQSCPEGSLGLASWFCDPERVRFRPTWSADFSQCKSIWLQRLAHQLDQILEASSSKQQHQQRQSGAEIPTLIRQQNEQTLRMVINDLALMARTKELFSEDLKRIDIMIGQIIAQLRSLSVSLGGMAPFGNSWRAPTPNSPFGSSLYEELFSKLVGIVSSLFDIAQRSAWLEIQPNELRRRLEQRFLNHLKDSGAMLAGSINSYQLAEPQQTWHQANVFASITVINGFINNNSPSRFSSNEQELETASGVNEFSSLQSKQSQLINLNKLVAEPDEQVNELKVHLSVLKELAEDGITRFLVLDIKKPDYSLIRQQLEISQGALSARGTNEPAFDSNLFAEPQWNNRVFGVFAVIGESGDILDGNDDSQREHKLTDLLAQRPISVDFKVSPPALLQSAPSHLLQLPATNALGPDSIMWPPMAPLPGAGQSSESTYEQDQLGAQQNRPDSMMAPDYIGPAQNKHPQQLLGFWATAFIVTGLALFVLTLAALIANATLRASAQSRLSKKQQAFLTGGAASMLAHHRDLSSGPTTGPLADHSLISDEQLITAGNNTASATTRSSSIMGLTAQSAAYHDNYKAHQQLYAAHLPQMGALGSADRWSRWIGWLRPARWLSSAGLGGSKDHMIQHRVIGSSLTSAGSSAYKSPYQNGYTTNLHHTGAAVAQLPLAAPSSSTSSYVSSSAYYEEIGPGNLTRVNTSQLTANSRPTHTIVDPFKPRQVPDQQQLLGHHHQHHLQNQIHHPLAHWSQPQQSTNPAMDSQQQQVNLASSSYPKQFHTDLSQLQNANSQSSNSSASNGSTPRHYLFASPNAVNAYKSSMNHYPTYHQQ